VILKMASSLVPANVLLSFFKDVTTLMKTYPQQESLSSLTGFDNNDASVAPPPGLERQRQVLLGTQMKVLESTIANYNNSNTKDDVMMQDAQMALRELGGGGEGPNEYVEIISDDVREELRIAMLEMTDAARIAFARAVLILELQWDEKRDDDDEGGNVLSRNLRGEEQDGSIDGAHVLEFCGLCNVAVKLPEVQRHLRYGTDMLRLFNETANDNAESTAVSDNDQTDQSLSSAPKERLEHIQAMLLRAIGYEPQFALDEFRRLFLSKDSNVDDPELIDVFATFVQSMSIVVTNATLGISADSNGMLSDVNEGGVTRVLSVEEKTVQIDGNDDEILVGSGGGGAPSMATMEQQRDVRQEEHLKMARQAAQLQQGIIDDLLSLDEHEREATLKDAKEAHEMFMEKASQVPEGVARIMLMQDLDPGTQRLLVMHKLWERMVAENGGSST